jgi:hypothetical protein
MLMANGISCRLKVLAVGLNPTGEWHGRAGHSLPTDVIDCIQLNIDWKVLLVSAQTNFCVSVLTNSPSTLAPCGCSKTGIYKRL